MSNHDSDLMVALSELTKLPREAPAEVVVAVDLEVAEEVEGLFILVFVRTITDSCLVTEVDVVAVVVTEVAEREATLAVEADTNLADKVADIPEVEAVVIKVVKVGMVEVVTRVATNSREAVVVVGRFAMTSERLYDLSCVRTELGQKNKALGLAAKVNCVANFRISSLGWYSWVSLVVY